MDKMKADVILENLSKMPIAKGEQSVIQKAISDENESKQQKRVAELAYRYALLLSTGANNTKRGEKILKNLKTCCMDYVNITNIQK